MGKPARHTPPWQLHSQAVRKAAFRFAPHRKQSDRDVFVKMNCPSGQSKLPANSGWAPIKNRGPAIQATLADIAPATFSETKPKIFPRISEIRTIAAAFPIAATSPIATPDKRLKAAVDA